MQASSPPPRRKSRLHREMSRDLDHSVASSTGSYHGTVSTDSTMTDFNPQRDEAIMSTGQMDYNLSAKLPELRDTAKKYGRWSPKRPEFVINTSALARAFPDFTQGSMPDDANSMESIEIGRGAKTRKRTPNRAPRVEYSDNFDSPIVIGDFQILPSPHRGQGQKESILKDALRNNAKKDTTPHRHTSSQKENAPSTNSQTGSPYISHASHTATGEQRSLAELHARVADDSNGSIIFDERPATTSQTKSTRFSGQSRAPHPAPVSKKQQIDADFAERFRAASGTPSRPPTRKSQTNNTTTSTTPNPTQQSFTFPNMPDFSHVVSSATSNGVPVVARGGKVQARAQNGVAGNSHEPVDGIEVPDEEEDIYLSVDLLKARVAELEMEKANSQRIIHDLERDNYQLRAEKQEFERRRRADSALGMADSGSDEGSDRERNIVAEKTKLEARALSLQSLLDASIRQVSNQELRLKTNTAERDQAVKQLAQAQILIEELKGENDNLKDENESLRAHLKQFMADADQDTHNWRIGEQALKQEVGTLKSKLAQFGAENEEHTRQWERKESTLKNQLAQFAAEIEQNARDWEKKESSLRSKLAQLVAESEENARHWEKKESSLQRKIQRQDEIVRELQEVTHEMRENTREIDLTISRRESASARSTKSKRKSGSQTKEKKAASKVTEQAQKHLEQMKSSNDDSSARDEYSTSKSAGWKPAELSFRPGSRSQSRRNSQNVEIDNRVVQETQNQQIVDKSVNDEESYDEESSSDTTIHKNTGDADNQEGNTLDGSDYESIVGPGFMGDLRQQLRESRAMKKEALAAAAAHDDTAQTLESVQSARSSRPASAQGLTGILKNRGPQNFDEFDLSARVSVKSAKSDGRVEEDHTTRSEASRNRRHSDSAVSARTKRRRNAAEDMTSEFIIPDISSNIHNNAPEHPALSANARRILDGLCKHDCKNCTVCNRVASFENNTGVKHKMHIPKPIPVSERMAVPAPYEDEPTIRPSVDPGLALATVIKGLDDEIAHLKIEHARIQSAYNKHDSSLGMRQRKALKKRLDKLLKAIDIKSDQVYALYDVLEGQKQCGQQMSEEEIEITLLSIGVDPEDFTKGSKKGGKQTTQHQNEDDDEDDSELDLPWEGIEETTVSIDGAKKRQT